MAANDRGPARDLLAVYAAYPYVVCADFLTPGGQPAFSWPVVGCANIRHGSDEVRIEVATASGPATLLVRYDRAHVLAGLHREFLVLGGLAVLGALAIILPATVTFLWTINRPLARMLASIEQFEHGDVAARVDYRSEDEIGHVIRSYNSMLDREVQRLAEIRGAHRAIVESVSYASRIQRGLLPRLERLAASFADFAVLWEPRDVVGGDIYWVSATGPRPTVVVLDCTGHGVPGGFMTMVAVSTLERIFGESEELAPADILSRLNELTRRLLNQDVADPTSNDGMDAAVCQIDPATRTAVFSGAHLSLLVARGDQVTRVRGDKTSIGYVDSSPKLRFKEKVVSLDPSTRLFMATDGVIDQPGGARQTAFGHERLMHSIARHRDGGLERVLEDVKAGLDAYAAGQPRRDDATIVAFVPRLP